VFEDLGFKNVQSVISSGNIVFDADSQEVKQLGAKLEEAWPKRLGFNSTTIIRSEEQIKKIVEADPFKEAPEDKNFYLNVTFLKNEPTMRLNYPYEGKDKSWKLLGIYENAVCSVTDLRATRSPDLYVQLEKLFTKEITTRTWQTVNRILKAFEKM
jgi:uncharacterized protein (DUF1697 family)